MNKVDVVQTILRDRARVPGAEGSAYAPANIALCKYWGKRDDELNLPVTSSLSMSLGALGAQTQVKPNDAGMDRVWLNGSELSPNTSFVRRVTAYLDLFRGGGVMFDVCTESTIPVAAGLASSASGYAALALALDACYGWKLDRRALSILARLGSGSASRSVYHGFVEWHVGARADGMDSVAERLDVEWPSLRIGLWELSTAEKPVGSRDAMKRTRDTSALYRVWPDIVADDLIEIHAALRARDIEALGRAAESNALAMHATMLGAWPPVSYWLPESVAAMQAIWAARADGVQVYFTMDAGPNIKCLFEAADEGRIRERFPALQIVNRTGEMEA